MNCDCNIQWLLEWSRRCSKHEIIGDCISSSGFMRLRELRIEDLGCVQGVKLCYCVLLYFSFFVDFMQKYIVFL